MMGYVWDHFLAQLQWLPPSFPPTLGNRVTKRISQNVELFFSANKMRINVVPFFCIVQCEPNLNHWVSLSKLYSLSLCPSVFKLTEWRHASLEGPVTGRETGHLNLLSAPQRICLFPPSHSAHPLSFSLQISNLKWEKASIQYCRVRVFAEQHSVFIRTLMDFHWGSWARPTTLTGGESGETAERAADR